MSKRHYVVSQQTKENLAQALKKLMTQKSLEKITIQEITALCGIKRQHFYYHFEDIYDLMRWMFQEEVVSILKKQEGVQLWQDGILQLFQYLQENREVCLCALNSEGRRYIKQFFAEDLHETIRHTVKQLGTHIGYQKTDDGPDNVEIITDFYVTALIGTMERWLMGDFNYTPEEIVRFVDQMLMDHIYGAAMRFQKENNCKDTKIIV